MDDTAQHGFPAAGLVFCEASHLQRHLHPVQVQVQLLILTHQFYPQDGEVDAAVQVGAAVIVENGELVRGELAVADLSGESFTCHLLKREAVRRR
jgi:hypothetical protein